MGLTIDSERRHHLANVIAIEKAFTNWNNVTPFQVRSHVTHKLGQNIKNLLRTKVR